MNQLTMKFPYTVLSNALVLTACNGQLPDESRVKGGSPESTSLVQQDTLQAGSDASGSTETADSADPQQDVPSGDVRLVDPNATAETVAVFARLKALAPDHTLFGMESPTTRGVFQLQDDGSVSREAADGHASDVRTLCGAGPGVYGFDVAGVVGDWWPDRSGEELQQLMDRSRAKQIEHARLIWERGGLLTMAWHAANPITNENYRKGPRELWRIVPPEACPAIEETLPELTGCGSHWNAFAPKLDILVEHFKNLRTEDGTPIPIIWRPWHENSGDWFWWGASRNADERYQLAFRAIWTWMVEYFQEQGVHNLLWAISPNGHGGWNPMDRAKYLSYAPDLSEVDVLGYDFYGSNLNRQPEASWGSGVLDEIAMVVDLAQEHDKIAAFTEGGSAKGLADEYSCDFWSQNMLGPVLNDPKTRGIAYFHVWTNDPSNPSTQWGPVPGHCSAQDFSSMCQKGEVLLEGDVDWTP